ncbi:uncharacterized protein FFB20_15906 [Fusarium fujikuroi]|nr:uncharacterized protein FFB20_15906 [Fusarium fujikuroi]
MWSVFLKSGDAFKSVRFLGFLAREFSLRTGEV